MKLKLKIEKPKFTLRIKEKVAPPPPQFPPLSPVLRDWLDGRSKPGPYLGEIDMSAVPSVKGPLKCYWIGSGEWMGTIWPNEGRHVSRAQDAWPERILASFQNMRLHGTVEAPKPKLRFKKPEVKAGFRLKLKTVAPQAGQGNMSTAPSQEGHAAGLAAATAPTKPKLSLKLKLKPKDDRTLWYHPESESYVECHTEAEAKAVAARFLDDVTGAPEHELAFAKSKAKPKLTLKLKPKLMLKKK